ncbi:MAG: hypothetical protein V9E88_01525 [Ferruginibacter sp.]
MEQSDLQCSWNIQCNVDKSTSGCDSIATLNLTVNNTLTSTTDVTICSNQLALLMEQSDLQCVLVLTM